ncbi:MAG: tRNA dihydrouridine synthase DusB [Myxococcota bacterium]
MPLRDLPPLRIGGLSFDPPVVMAPMAGVSESPYRIIALEMGAGMTPTELVSAKGLQYANARTEAYLRHDSVREPILAVQLYGGDPEAMADAAERVVERGAQLVDVNMGCPVKKVTRNQAGSALMLEPEKAAAVVASMAKRVSVPVTAKLRSGWDEDQKNAPELGARLRDAGAAAIALHARTRAQGYEGQADWRMIERLRVAVPDVPVIANGDVDGPDAADAVVDQTGCDAVMVGRAALGNPWIFRALRARHRGEAPPAPPRSEEQIAIILRHFRASLVHAGPERGLKKFRTHLSWYSRSLRGGARFRERVMQIEAPAEVEAAIRGFFGSAEIGRQEVAEYDPRVAYG